MKHARPDYNRMQDPAGIIPDDEPVMLFRGQDVYASSVLRFYAHLLNATGGDPAIIERVKKQAELMDAWPKKKMPDVTPAQWQS